MKLELSEMREYERINGDIGQIGTKKSIDRQSTDANSLRWEGAPYLGLEASYILEHREKDG